SVASKVIFNPQANFFRKILPDTGVVIPEERTGPTEL
ncbi:hypothetical protein M2449_004020, partial [Dysgonomonas sp. PF1-16]|nr:hypothetical protein [Dysgonomonas sp. PF1-16]